MTTEKPTIVCLCGSTRNKSAFEAATKELTLQGCIVLSVGFFAHIDGGLDMAGETKRELDRLHFRKIEMADAVLVLNVDGRIGLSTCDELHYALALKKRVWFLNPLPQKSLEELALWAVMGEGWQGNQVQE